MIEAVFFISLSLVLYPYAAYPLLLVVLAPLRSRLRPERSGAGDGAALPSMTVLVAARNEEARIGAKVADVFAQDYPPALLDMIVVSDASDDGTDEIVTGARDPRVRLVRAGTRLGKVAAQNLAIPQATGEILVFTDAATRFEPRTLRLLAGHFADPSIGCVSTEDRLTGHGGEGLYARYEMALRRLETRFYSIAGASGSGYAVRRSLMGTWPGGYPNDFITPLKVIAAGRRAISEPRAVGVYAEAHEAREEFRRKVRTVLRGMATLWAMRELLNPIRYPRASFILISHKLLRWTVPWFLLVTLAANIVLGGTHPAWRWMLAAQGLLYLGAVAGACVPALRRIAPIKIAHFFLMVNLAIAVAWVQFLAGERAVTWEPTRRQATS